LLLSAYTANLASFLVAKAEAGSVFENLQEAVNKNKIICTAEGSAKHEWFDQEYPGYTNLKFLKGNIVAYADALAEGECDGALLSMDQFKEMTHMPEIKNRCDLRIVGLPLTQQAAGFMVGNDYRHKCTILVRDVLSFHFMSMAADGTLKKMKQAAFDTLAPTCPKEALEDDAEEAGQLDFESMFGILLMHILGIAVAMGMFVASRAWEKFGKQGPVTTVSEADKEDLPTILAGVPLHYLPDTPTPAMKSGEQSTEIVSMRQQLSHILSDLKFLKDHVEDVTKVPNALVSIV